MDEGTSGARNPRHPSKPLPREGHDFEERLASRATDPTRAEADGPTGHSECLGISPSILHSAHGRGSSGQETEIDPAHGSNLTTDDPERRKTPDATSGAGSTGVTALREKCSSFPD
jgi:hypothetical protein